MKTLNLLVLFLFISIEMSATVCRIDFSFKGLENKQLILAHQYGKRQIPLDTVTLDKQGEGFYQSNEKLSGGLYLLVFPDKKFYEFVVDNEQYFTLRSDTSNLFNNMSIEGSVEASIYQDYQLKSSSVQAQIQKIYKERLSASKDSLAAHKVQVARLNAELKLFRKQTADKMPGSFIAHLFALMDEPEYIAPGKNIPEKNAIIEQYNYLVNHYFDLFVFSDERLLRTAIFEEKIDFYFNKLIKQNKDTITKRIDWLMGKAEANQQVYRFILNYLVANYRNIALAESENVFLYLIDNYYMAGKAKWADERFLKLMRERADNIRTTLVGSKAVDLPMLTPDEKPLTLYSVNAAYTIVYFWAPDCERCKTVTPALYSLYSDFKSKGVKVFAVFTYADKTIWVDALKNQDLDWINVYDPLLKSNFPKLYKVNDTPTLYLLDKDKKIISKNLSIDNLRQQLNSITLKPAK